MKILYVIDDSAAERGMLGLAIRRKNWMFAGSEGGGHNAAFVHTLIETAKVSVVDPQAWLTNVPSQIADHPVNRIAERVPRTFSS